MSGVVGWLRFAGELAPVLRALVRDLYARHRGNVEAAKDDINSIRDHWASNQAVEAEVDARIHAVRERDKS